MQSNATKRSGVNDQFHDILSTVWGMEWAHAAYSSIACQPADSMLLPQPQGHQVKYGDVCGGAGIVLMQLIRPLACRMSSISRGSASLIVTAVVVCRESTVT